MNGARAVGGGLSLIRTDRYDAYEVLDADGARVGAIETYGNKVDMNIDRFHAKHAGALVDEFMRRVERQERANRSSAIARGEDR